MPATRPAVTIATLALGHSVSGEPLELHVFGPPSGGTLVVGGVHGDEPAGAEVARRLLAYVRDHPDVAESTGAAILPVANPDGLAAGTRTNANGVDVNRNFPASNWKPTSPGTAKRPNRSFTGPFPAREPETRALLRCLEIYKPRRVVSIHAGLHCNNYDGPGEDLAAMMAGYNGYPPQASVGYPTPGSMGTYVGIDQHIPIITLEFPKTFSPDRAWAENREALLAVIRTDDLALSRRRFP